MILEARNLHLAYEEREVVHGLSLAVRSREVISLIGPNGSGKSTILRALSRTLRPRGGAVYLNGHDIHSLSPSKLAKQLAILPQAPQAPSDLTVRDLVWYGRSPHQRWWRRATAADADVVAWALAETKLERLADRPVATLSGGERQRAWIALALAQTPEVLLLDEPTTYLDIAHQLEVMELIRRLNRSLGLTVIMVLHDINQAARYSDRLIALQNGRLVAEGEPARILTPALFRQVFGVEARIEYDADGVPLCLPLGLAVGE
ncbi:MAG: ABC transporter ATP-binding protein [Betaproteobacteria bacterium]